MHDRRGTTMSMRRHGRPVVVQTNLEASRILERVKEMPDCIEATSGEFTLLLRDHDAKDLRVTGTIRPSKAGGHLVRIVFETASPAPVRTFAFAVGLAGLVT